MSSLAVRLRNRFMVHGLFWRQFCAWASENVPFFLEPLIMAAWSLFFYLLWSRGRRGVMGNLRVVSPRANWLTIFFRGYRVFWNFACTFTDTTRFNVNRTTVDWEVEGTEHVEQLAATLDGAIILTAHMGNYDLGSYLFAGKVNKPIYIVRAADVDADTDRHAKRFRETVGKESGRIEFCEPTPDLALKLVSALREGALVAIQGDRMVEGVSQRTTMFFGREVVLPAGPMALAMATQAVVFPVFIVRMGWRRYRAVVTAPIHVQRTSRDREPDLAVAMLQWSASLEAIVRRYWYQWYNFDSLFSHAGN